MKRTVRVLLGSVAAIAAVAGASYLTGARAEPPVPQPVRIGTSAPKLGADASKPTYRSVLLVWGKNNAVDIRFDMRTGEAALLDTAKPSKKVAETGKVPEGEYDVQMIGTDKEFWTVRIERKTGRCWAMYKGQWNDIVEAREPAAGDFELKMAAIGEAVWIRRFDRNTGHMWCARWEDGAFRWNAMAD